MAVAWIGNRAVLLEQAAEEAARLLGASNCPVITLDTDVHATRAAIGLAARIGAAVDVSNADVFREAMLIADKGAMTVAPGETRRRADMLVVVGEMPPGLNELVADLASSKPDLSGGKPRRLFVIGAKGASFGKSAKPVALAAGKSGVAATLAVLRAQLAGRQVRASIGNFEAFQTAIEAAQFPVFIYSGHGCDALALEMLQGLVADLNKTKRASTLHLTADENSWGSTLASTWITGFPGRMSFARGKPEFDPWRFDTTRMISSGEADLHVSVSSGGLRKAESTTALIAIAATAKAMPGAAVTIATGGGPSDGVVYSAGLGALQAVAAQASGDLPDPASVLRAVARHCGAEAWRC